jgi:hypothetical protein
VLNPVGWRFEGNVPMKFTRVRMLAFVFVVGCSGTGDFNPNRGIATGFAGSSPVAGNGAASPGAALAGAGAAGGAAILPPTTLNLTGAPQYSRFIRLTNAQWARSVQDILALPMPSGLESGFQDPVAGTTDFTNNELVLNVDQRAVADFEGAAESLAASVTASSAALTRIYPGTDPAGFIATLGRRAYRRPLRSSESATYLALFNQGATLSGTQSAFAKGAGLVIRAMLQSPYFLYRTELSDVAAPLNTYEIAAKLSLWLRGTTPNDALLDAAAQTTELSSAEGAAKLATTMLEEPTAVAVMRSFHNTLYHFDRYSTISKIGVKDYDPSLNVEYLDTSNLFFDRLFTQGLGVKELLTSTTGFVGPRLAAIYGVSAPANGYAQLELGARRVGYFSQIPFLSLYGLNADPDSIHRGVTINLDVLCALLGPPAANLPPIPPLQPGQTNRQRISMLTEGCGATCHKQQINPLGFSFEHFDGMGRYRDVENGNLPIDSSGSFTFSEGARSFANAAELMQLMASGQQAHTCYAKKLASFGLQRDIVDKDLPLLATLAKASMENGSIKSIMLALVRSDSFRVRSGAGQ